MIVRMIDGIVDFFRPSSFKMRRTTIRRMWPVLRLSLLYYWKRNLLITLCIVFAVYTSVIFYAYLGMAQQSFARQVDPLELPLTAVFGRPGVFSDSELTAIERTVRFRYYQTGLRTNIETSFGRKSAFVFALGDELAQELVGGTATEPTLYVPERYREMITSNGIVQVENLHTGRHQRHNVAIGTFVAQFDYFDLPVLFLPPESLPAAVNQIYIFDHGNETENRLILRDVQRNAISAMYGEDAAERENDRMPYYLIDTDTGKRLAVRIQANKLSTARNTLFLVYLFSLIAVYNILFISFFDRQREVGILKTIGLENTEIFVLLQTETLYCSLIGVAITPFLAWLTIWILEAQFNLSLALPIVRMMVIAAVSVVLFYIGAVLPSAMVRHASITSLLRGEGFSRENQWAVMHHEVW